MLFLLLLILVPPLLLTENISQRGGTEGQVLKRNADGVSEWSEDIDTIYQPATQSADGLMSATDKAKLDGIASLANNYSLPTASASTLGGIKVGTNLSISSGVLSATDTTYANFVKSGSTAKAGLVPAPSTTAGTTKYLREDCTWQVPPNTNTTYSNFVKSGSTAAAGLVPSPGTTAGTTKYLREDCTWQVPPNTNTTYTGANGISLSGTTFSNSGVRSIATGGSNGTISVNTNGTAANVAVKGLGSAAYTASTAYAAASHGNHVPTTQTASNKVFLRNDNTWQTITPANIGAAASSHTHSYMGTASTTKATSTAGGTTTSEHPAVVVKTYLNGEIWYRKYSDGWIEQGGISPAVAGQTLHTITLPCPMTTKLYTILVTGVEGGNGENSGIDPNAGRTTTTMSIRSEQGNRTKHWVVFGY